MIDEPLGDEELPGKDVSLWIDTIGQTNYPTAEFPWTAAPGRSPRSIS
jgi:hypothetical protein